MGSQLSTRTDLELDHRSARYNPLLITVLTLIAGVCFDRFCELPWQVWLVAAVVFGCVWIAVHAGNQTVWAAICAGCFVFCCGGFRHHVHWNHYPPNEISKFVAQGESQVRVKCVALSESRWVPAPSPHPMNLFESAGYSLLRVKIYAIADQDRFVDTTGVCQLFITGDHVPILVGDQLLVLGRCEKFKPPGNPGEFDMRSFYRGRRQLVSLSANSPESVTHIKPGNPYSPNRWMSNLRVRLQEKLNRHLSEENVSMASAIMLGYREQIDRNQRERFMLTGTVHLLAISGLHVGILAALFIWLGRLGIVNERLMLLLTVLFVLFYAWLVEFRPPVTRAAILVILYCVAKWTGRAAFTINTLAAAAIIVFVLNPADVFNVGAQLSFVAVATIALGQWLIVNDQPRDPLDELILRASPWPIKIWRNFKSLLWNSFVVSLLVWAGSAVLIAYYFNLVTPAALVCNPLLVIPMAVALISGFLLLSLGIILPPLAPLFGGVCNTSLWAMNEVIEIGQWLPFGSWWTCGPGLPGLIVFYLMVILFATYPPTRIPTRWIGAIVLVWLATVVVFSPAFSRSNRLRMDFADVGHGSCAIVEFPNGKVMLFDAGSSMSRHRTADVLCRSLWSKGISNIDGIVVSHADLDHFNAIPTIAERFSIGQVFVSQPMLKSNSPAVLELFRVLEERSIDIAIVQVGDELKMDDRINVSVLHPGIESTNEGDNSDSIAIEIDNGNAKVLLPGDLESKGLVWLMSFYSKDYDLVVAPHHGSGNSMPSTFVNWAQPEHVVISADQRKVPGLWKKLESGNRTVWRTGEDGAITVEFFEDRIEVSGYRGK